MQKSSSPTRRIRSVHVVAAAAVVLAMSGSATAAMVVTGKDIKNSTITSKDIKNGSLKVKDFKSSERSKLRGPAGASGAAGAAGATGAPGAAGPAGASAFAPPPSGTVIKGGGILNVDVSGAVQIRSFAPLPFTTTAPLTRGTGRNLWFGSQNGASLGPSEVDAVKCPGTATDPNPTAGNMCVYVSQVGNIAATSTDLWPGPDDASDAAESNGFYLISTSGGAGPMLVRYVWAYKAP